MDCLPLDDICNINKIFQASDDDDRRRGIEATTIGVFNGRVYTFATVKGVPVIYIENKGGEDRAPDILDGGYDEWNAGKSRTER